MRSARVVFAVTAVALLALSACSRDRAPTLMNVRSETNGPDEFSILPPRALEMPEDLTALPEPSNRRKFVSSRGRGSFAWAVAAIAFVDKANGASMAATPPRKLRRDRSSVTR